MQILGGGSVKGRRWGAGEGKQATGIVPRFASGSAVLTAAVEVADDGSWIRLEAWDIEGSRRVMTCPSEWAPRRPGPARESGRWWRP